MQQNVGEVEGTGLGEVGFLVSLLFSPFQIAGRLPRMFPIRKRMIPVGFIFGIMGVRCATKHLARHLLLVFWDPCFDRSLADLRICMSRMCQECCATNLHPSRRCVMTMNSLGCQGSITQTNSPPKFYTATAVEIHIHMARHKTTRHELNAGRFPSIGSTMVRGRRRGHHLVPAPPARHVPAGI